MVGKFGVEKTSLNKAKKFRIFVFANLKPSQINYKIIPLSKSSSVEQVVILRKTPLEINEDKILCLHLPWILRFRPIYWFLSFIYGIYQIKKNNTNLILSYNIFPHGLNAYLSSVFVGQKAIFSEINEDTIRYYKKSLSKLLVKKILDNASIICTPGENTASFWNKVGYNKTIQLHSTIDVVKFKPDHSIKKKYDILYIGTLDENKRPEIIVKAFGKLANKNKDLKFCLIGFGSLETKIKQLIIQLNIKKNVVFITTNDVLKYIQESKIFVMSSLSEGLPCAMLEAMACELIAIVPPVGDISDVISHGVNGFLHNNTVEEIEYFMDYAISNYNDLDQMKKNARLAILNGHSYEVATNKWNNLLGSFNIGKI